MDDGHVDPVAKAQRVPPPDPTRADLVAPHEITAVGIEMLINEDTEVAEIQRLNKANAAGLRLEDDFAKTNPQTTAQAKHKPSQQPPEQPLELHLDTAPAVAAAQKRPEPPPVSAAARVTQHAAPPKQPAAAAKSSATAHASSAAPRLDAFFRGAGLPSQRLDDREAEQVLQRLGQIMREVVLGVSENLHLRAEQKNVMRVPTTTIQAQNNNPLKFSASVEEALNSLLFRESSEYLSAVEAVREAFGDIKQHQQHLLSGVRTAVGAYIARLDPEELEAKVGRGNVLLGAANKLKYWDLFKDLYQVVAQQQPGQFPHQFIDELARAYELEGSRATPAAAGRLAKSG
jgi:type VI secretion system protein